MYIITDTFKIGKRKLKRKHKNLTSFQEMKNLKSFHKAYIKIYVVYYFEFLDIMFK